MLHGFLFCSKCCISLFIVRVVQSVLSSLAESKVNELTACSDKCTNTVLELGSLEI